MTTQLCLACSSTIPANAKPSSIFVHSCCSRPVCATCLAQNARLTTFCPICEDASAAFRRGPRHDVTRVGQVVFDAEAALSRDQEDGMPPPAYIEAVGEGEAGEKDGAFALGDDGSEDEDKEQRSAKDAKTRSNGKTRQAAGPSLLTRQGSKSSAGAEVDMMPSLQAGSSNETHQSDSTDPPASFDSFRQKVNPHQIPPTGPSSSRPGDGQTRQYFLRKTDTIQSLSIRFSVTPHELVLLNSLPRSILSTSPHLLHTRSFILIPAHAVEASLAANPDLLESLAGPPQKSAKEKTTAARRTAEAKFRASLATSGKVGETQADEKAARVYVGIAEDEFRMVDFGEGRDELSLPRSYEEDAGEEMEEAQRDTARRARFDAILKHALGKWEMDSDWERSQRANGINPSSVSKPIPSSAPPTSSGAKPEKPQESSKISKWFSRALNAKPLNPTPNVSQADRGEHTSPFSPRPRHVVALSSSVKLPTVVSQTFSAHKGPVNVARYNSLGRYILTGGSDRTIRLWNAKTGGSGGGDEAIATYRKHAHEVLALDVSRDNSRFASGGVDKSVFVWDVATGSVARRFSGFLGKVNDVRFGGKDGDGAVIVVGGLDGVVRVFDLRAQGAWRSIMELKEAKDAVTSLAVRDDRIYTGSVDGVLRCYDLRSGELRSDTLPAPITGIAPSRLGTSILVSTLDSTVRLLDTRDGTLLQSYKGHKHDSYRCRADLTNAEDGVVMGDEEGNLTGWDLVSSERVDAGPRSAGKAHAKPILWVELNPDTSLSTSEMVTAGADGIVKVWTTV